MTDKNKGASVQARLKSQAKEQKKSVEDLLNYYGMQRFLYRLSESAHREAFVLKGALMLHIWGAADARATRDIDFQGITANDIEKIEGQIRDILSVDVQDDGVSFDPDTIKSQEIKEDAEYSGVRMTFKGTLGTARLNMQIDVGFGDVVHPEPIEMDIPAILSDMPDITLRCYSRETAIAEKYQAMTDLGMFNSRMKDFYDIWLLASQFDFSGEDLSLAVQKTFENRKTEVSVTPDFLTDDFLKEKQVMWSAFLKKKAKGVPAPEKLEDAITAINDFLEPVANVISEGGLHKGTWKAGKGWEE